MGGACAAALESVMGQGYSRVALGALAAGMIFGAASALAQPAPVRVRGPIEKVDGGTLTVKTREGDTVTVKVPDNVGVAGVVKRTLADIKPNDFVGIAAMPQAGKPSRALEVLIFPETMRGESAEERRVGKERRSRWSTDH